MTTKSKPKDSASTNVSRDELKAMISEELRTAKGKRKADLIRQYTKLQRWDDRSISMKPHSTMTGRKRRARAAQEQCAEKAREMLEAAHAELRKHFPELVKRDVYQPGWEPEQVILAMHYAGRDWQAELKQHGLYDRPYWFIIWLWALQGQTRPDGTFYRIADFWTGPTNREEAATQAQSASK